MSEVDVMSAWHGLKFEDYTKLKEYNIMFCNFLLCITSILITVPFVEQLEKYCCRLPKEHYIKIKLTNMFRMIENAQTSFALLTGNFHNSNLHELLE